MIRKASLFIALCATGTSCFAYADATDASRHGGGTRAELPPYLQCVPYARQQSGVNIFGDAHTWWAQAKGRYARGKKPKVGAVMAFAPHRNMRLGHVAAVSKVIDSRTVLLDHANWSPINGRRGQIEKDVKAVDVSPNNDWSMVKVWYHPIHALGKTPWPVRGFIYPKKPGIKSASVPNAKSHARATKRPAKPRYTIKQPVNREPSKAFSDAFGSLGKAAPARPRPSVKPSVTMQRNYRQAAPLQRKAAPYRQQLKPLAQTHKNAADNIYAAVNKYE